MGKIDHTAHNGGVDSKRLGGLAVIPIAILRWPLQLASFGCLM